MRRETRQRARLGRAVLGVWVGALVLSAAWTAQAQTRAAWPELSGAGPRAGDGRYDAAVVVGVEDYVFAPDIEGARRNADAWYTWLVRARGVPAERVTLLRDREGTREAVEDGLKRAAAQVGPGGTLWFVFIGHGAPSLAAPGGGVLVGADAQLNPRSIEARSLAQADLGALVAQRKGSGPTVAVLDACFSGRTSSGAALVPNLQPLVPSQTTAATSRMTVLTASGADQFAGPLPGAQRPAFSYLTLGALRGWGDVNGDRRVTAREATDYARRALQTVVKDRSQHPQLTGRQPDVVLSDGAGEPGPDLAAMVLSAPAARPPGGNTGPRVTLPARPRRPRRRVARNGLLKLSAGWLGLSASAFDQMSGSVDVAYDDANFGRSSTLNDLKLESTEAGADLTSVGLDFVVGEQGASLLLSAGLGWGSEIKANTRVRSDDDILFAEDEIGALQNGVSGVINDLFAIQAAALGGYRQRIGIVGLWAYGGVGFQLHNTNITFTVDGVENTHDMFGIDLVLPVRAGLDVELTPDVVAHAGATYYIISEASLGAQAGIGFYY